MSKDFLEREADNLLAPKRSGDEDSEENEKKARWKGLDEEEDDDGGEYKHPHYTRQRPKQAPPPPRNTDDMEISSSDDDNGDDINSPNEEGEDNEQDADASPRRRTVNITTPPPTTTPRAPQPQKRHYSGLARAAATIVHAHDRDELFADDVAWQRSIHNDAALIKRFRSEVLQHSGLVVFAFMRSGSPYIHLLHPRPPTSHTNGTTTSMGRI